MVQPVRGNFPLLISTSESRVISANHGQFNSVIRVMKLLLVLVLSTLISVPVADGSNGTGFQLTLRAKSPQSKKEPVVVEFTIQNVTKKMLWLQDTTL